jgi:hypothetical protein
MDISIRMEPAIPAETSTAVNLEKFLHKLWLSKQQPKPHQLNYELKIIITLQL